MARQRRIRLCVDRVVPFVAKVAAAERSIKENRNNAPAIDLRPGVSRHPLKLALETGKLWKRKRIRVKFMDGTVTQKRRVMEHAKSWSEFAGITFAQTRDSAAEIRVSFEFDTGSWSAVGTDSLATDYFPKREPTMNFGWLTDDTDDTEYRRVVVHEFGHALGAIHEHQNPRGGIRWNLPAVYEYFSGPPNNWSKEEIDYNVVQKYSMDQINGTRFDRKSIMLYSFPKELVRGGTVLPENSRLSAGDKRFIAKTYPKRART
jgi:hypothetical protein